MESGDLQARTVSGPVWGWSSVLSQAGIVLSLVKVVRGSSEGPSMGEELLLCWQMLSSRLSTVDLEERDSPWF